MTSSQPKTSAAVPDALSGAGDIPPDDAVMQSVSRRRAAIWSMILFYPALALVLARNLALVPLYLKYIGKTEFDAWLVTGAVLMQLTNVDFGLMGVLMQQVAAAYGNRNRQQLEQLIGTGLVLAAAISLLMGGCTAAISPFLPKLIDTSPDIGHRLTSCFLIVALANAVQLFGFATGGMLKSLQRTFLAGFFVLLSEVASLLSTVYFILHGWGLYAIALGLVIRAVVEVTGTASTFLWIILRRLELRLRWDWLQVRRLWGFSIYQFLTQIAGRIKIVLDTFLIGVFVNPEAGGGYALTTRAHDTVRLSSSGFTGALSHPLAHLHGEGNVTRFKEVIISLFKVTLLAAAMGYGCVIALNQTFMLVWVGPRIYSGAAINVLAALGGIAFALIMVPYEAIFTRAGFSVLTRVVWLEVVVRVAVMIWLLRTIGVVGAPLASLLCQILLILLPLTWINARALQFTRAEIGSMLGSTLKMMTGPLLLAATFAWVLRSTPVLCTYIVAPAASDLVVQNLAEQFPPESGIAISHDPGAPRIYVSASPAQQQRISASTSGIAKSTPAPAKAWLILVAEACLFLILCLIYTWIIDRQWMYFMLRGGREAAD